MSVVIAENSNGSMTHSQKQFYRGEVYMVDFGQKDKDNRVQGGLRPAIIVTNPIGCKFSPVLHVIPLTSVQKRYMPTHVHIPAADYGLYRDSTALVEQTILVDKNSFKNQISKLDDFIMSQIDKALSFVFSI